jgi:hypothetical protein
MQCPNKEKKNPTLEWFLENCHKIMVTFHHLVTGFLVPPLCYLLLDNSGQFGGLKFCQNFSFSVFIF